MNMDTNKCRKEPLMEFKGLIVVQKSKRVKQGKVNKILGSDKGGHSSNKGQFKIRFKICCLSKSHVQIRDQLGRECGGGK